jgi:hypothetical protein
MVIQLRTHEARIVRTPDGSPCSRDLAFEARA